jgi:hypothetical protein
MGDLDNGIKPLMDWLQRVELIENDKWCDRILAQWGEPRSTGPRRSPMKGGFQAPRGAADGLAPR